MTDFTKVRGRNVAIDYAATKSFFDARGQRSYATPLSATMYQDDNPGLVQLRDQAEKDVIAQKLDLSMVTNILDIGCGVGRWGWFLADKLDSLEYLGIDFSTSLIEKAREQSAKLKLDGINFQVMSAIDIESEKLLLAPPYNLILLSGLLIYLNDTDCLNVLNSAARLCKENGQIYLREPVGLLERFTLNRFYSSELSQEYSAIYRSVDELEELIHQAFGDDNFDLIEDGFLFPKRLEKREETRQYYKILQRKG